MQNAEIVRFLRCPSSPLVDFAVSTANLTEKEALAISLCGRMGLTQEQAAEKAGYSVDAVQKWNRAGMKKLNTAWSGQWWIQKLTQ